MTGNLADFLALTDSGLAAGLAEPTKPLLSHGAGLAEGLAEAQHGLVEPTKPLAKPAKALLSQAGSRGGRASAERLTAEERSARARKAAFARHAKSKKHAIGFAQSDVL